MTTNDFLSLYLYQVRRLLLYSVQFCGVILNPPTYPNINGCIQIQNQHAVLVFTSLIARITGQNSKAPLSVSVSNKIELLKKNRNSAADYINFKNSPCIIHNRNEFVSFWLVYKLCKYICSFTDFEFPILNFYVLLLIE
jgi:hypothetical protein